MVSYDYRIRENLPISSEEAKKLARKGLLEVELAEKEMPGVRELVLEYGEGKPLAGAKVAGCLHLTVETAVLVKALRSLGASVRWCSCNVFSTEDHAAAYLASEGFPVFAWKGMSEKEYWECIEKTLGDGPDLIIDDGGDMTRFVLDRGIKGIRGVAEETTTGVRLLRRRESLPFPAIAVNDLMTKSQFDNRYGCRESLLAGLMQGSGAMIGGKVAVVAGYGDVGRGCVEALSGLGARVIITEIDPIAAYRAVMEGYQVTTMDEAAPLGDLFITATGCMDVITGRHLEAMKDGAVLANIGHFDCEIDVSYLKTASHIEKLSIKPLVDKYTWKSGKSVLLLGEGRLVNLSLASGHPSFVMSNSFCGQILAMLELWRGDYKPGVHKMPRLLDEKIARLHLKPLGAKLTKLTQEQADYLGVSQNGPFKG